MLWNCQSRSLPHVAEQIAPAAQALKADACLRKSTLFLCQGRQDVCVLNFLVFLFWDYIPPVWLVLVMTTGNANSGVSTVKVCNRRH